MRNEGRITMRTRTKILVAGVFAVINATASAQTAPPASRGELLYTTYCIACHTAEVHWRQKKLAVDWASLNQQVRRWAGNAGLAWGDEEIVEVARYLNTVHYRFEAPSVTGLGHHEFTRGIAVAD
jgi:mono/diheme cytochrome c family protein